MSDAGGVKRNKNAKILIEMQGIVRKYGIGITACNLIVA